MAVAGLRWRSGAGLSPLAFLNTATPTVSSMPTATITPTALPQPTITIMPTPTPAPKPEFILVFVPVDWRAGPDEFEQVARQHADVFIRESEIELYFTVSVVILQPGLENADLSSETLAYDVLEYGLTQIAGDRYIGMTDGDLSPFGESDIAGWTAGGQSMVVEAEDNEVTAHELGHTFGLCDEYNYAEWSRQNDEYTDGCPNLYPPTCPMTMSGGVTCEGTPTEDGRNSIMGPGGMPGSYGFNAPSLSHLLKVLSILASQVIP